MQIEKAMVVGAFFACCGLWLFWRGIRNDVSYHNLGEPLVPRWMYVVGGLLLAGIASAYIVCLLVLRWPR